MDTLPKLALKRAGAFICSLDSNPADSLGENLNKCPVRWIQKDQSVTNLQTPKEILVHGYEKLKNDSRWGQKQKEAYNTLMRRLSDV